MYLTFKTFFFKRLSSILILLKFNPSPDKALTIVFESSDFNLSFKDLSSLSLLSEIN